jgi:lipopolysaccharide/colanic/teichoic acid biosynthesis glycosyltransferase
MKRLMDFLFSLMGIVVLTPILAVIAVFIWVESGLPVFFVQSRVGKEGRGFKLIKFRTMMVSPGSENGVFEPGHRHRTTSVGRFLRKTKIDELPQILNVLMGDMSFVGPRPEIRRWVDAYPERWAFVHTVRPGMTDPASIIYRNEEELLAGEADPEKTYRERILPHKLSLYEDYIRRRNGFLDLSIIVRTFCSVLKPGFTSEGRRDGAL